MGSLPSSDEAKYRLQNRIAQHRIKHGLSSMISFFEPPGRSGGRGRGHDSGDGRGGIEVVGKVIGEEVVTVHGGG